MTPDQLMSEAVKILFDARASFYAGRYNECMALCADAQKVIETGKVTLDQIIGGQHGQG